MVEVVQYRSRVPGMVIVGRVTVMVTSEGSGIGSVLFIEHRSGRSSGTGCLLGVLKAMSPILKKSKQK